VRDLYPSRAAVPTRMHRAPPPHSPAPLPSFHNPFIFFHIAKTSGSTLESYIYESTVAGRFPSAITCRPDCWYRSSAVNSSCPFAGAGGYTPILCERPAMACASVFAGHFQPDLIPLIRHPACAERPRWVAEPREATFTCVIFLREPLSRTISWYHDKRAEAARVLPFANMSLLDQLALIQRYELGSAMVRWLSTSAPGPRNVTLHPFDPQRGVPSINRAKAFLDKCTIGLQDRVSESYRAISHAFPWLKLPSQEARVEHPSSHIQPGQLSGDAQVVLRSFLYPDILLYTYALERFEQQLRGLAAG